MALNIAKDILYAGVEDRDIDLFEGQYPVPDGITYNSYIIRDEQTAVMDGVDGRGKVAGRNNGSAGRKGSGLHGGASHGAGPQRKPWAFHGKVSGG